MLWRPFLSLRFCWRYLTTASTHQLETFLNPIQVRYRAALRPVNYKSKRLDLARITHFRRRLLG